MARSEKRGRESKKTVLLSFNSQTPSLMCVLTTALWGYLSPLLLKKQFPSNYPGKIYAANLTVRDYCVCVLHKWVGGVVCWRTVLERCLFNHIWAYTAAGAAASSLFWEAVLRGQNQGVNLHLNLASTHWRYFMLTAKLMIDGIQYN